MDVEEKQLEFVKQGNELDIRLHGSLAALGALVLAGATQLVDRVPASSLRLTVWFGLGAVLVGIAGVALDRLRHWLASWRAPDCVLRWAHRLATTLSWILVLCAVTAVMLYTRLLLQLL